MAEVQVEIFLDKHLETERKDLDNLLKRVAKRQNSLKRGIKTGDVTGIIEALQSLIQEGPAAEGVFQKVLHAHQGYNLADYLAEGFDGPFRRLLADEDIPVRGEFPSYEIFPLIVRIYPAEGYALVNKLKVKGLRLKNLIQVIKKERDKFFKSPFRAEEFLKDLAATYDRIMQAKRGKTMAKLPSLSIPILELYNALTPMGRWRREYTKNLFGFDIYRLLREEANNPGAVRLVDEKGTRRCIFGSIPIGSRSGITIVEENGRETTFGSVKFEAVEG